MLSFTAQSEWWYWLWLRSECQVNRSIRLNQYETFSSFIKSTFHYYYFFFFCGAGISSWNEFIAKTNACGLSFISDRIGRRYAYDSMTVKRNGYYVSYRASSVDAINVQFVVRYPRCYPIWDLCHSMRSEPVVVCNVWWNYAIGIRAEYTASFHLVWFYEINRMVMVIGMWCDGVYSFILLHTIPMV